MTFKLGITATISILLTLITIKFGWLEYSRDLNLLYGGVTGLTVGIIFDARRKQEKNVTFSKKKLIFSIFSSLICIGGGVLITHFLALIFALAFKFSYPFD